MFFGYSSKISKYYSIDNISVGTLFQKDTSLGTQLCQIYNSIYKLGQEHSRGSTELLN